MIGLFCVNLEKMVLHGFNDEVLAVVILLQQRLTVNLNIKDIIEFSGKYFSKTLWMR